MGSTADKRILNAAGGFIPMEMVVNGTLELITDETKGGACLWITKRRGLEYWPTPVEENKYMIPSLRSKKSSNYIPPSNIDVPNAFEKVVVHTLSHDFRSATKIVRTQLSLPIKPEHALVKILYAGVNASDVNYSSGRYFSGDTKEIAARLPFDAGFELAKLAGNKVVATCGGESKAKLLRSLGADRVIDYRKENIKDVLIKEFPNGVDIIYESVGGEMFNVCLNALAVYGRLIVIGMVSQAGFFLNNYSHLWHEHVNRLFDLYSSGKLKIAVDPKKFLGLASVADAVEHLHSGQSLGKVVVCIDPAFGQQNAKL